MIARDHLAGIVERLGVASALKIAFSLLTRQEKLRAAVLFVSMVINALLGLAGLASIVPFVNLLLSPDPLGGSGLAARALRQVGIANVDRGIFIFGLVVLGLLILKNVYALLHLRIQNGFCARIETRLASNLLGRVISAPYLWLIEQNSARLQQVVYGGVIDD